MQCYLEFLRTGHTLSQWPWLLATKISSVSPNLKLLPQDVPEMKHSQWDGQRGTYVQTTRKHNGSGIFKWQISHDTEPACTMEWSAKENRVSWISDDF